MSNLLRPFLPDFIGIGAMRSGTSWVSRNLAKHPEVMLANRKELHFFDHEYINSQIPILPKSFVAQVRYARYFIRGSLLRKVKGEFTPAYAILPVEIIKIIRAWMPDLKLIYVMRDPVDRAWSHARKDYQHYYGKPLQEASVDELVEYFKQPAVANRGDYATCLTNWFSSFPRERFFIAFTDEISGEPADLLDRMLEFLGVDASTDFDKSNIGSQVNTRPSVTMPSEIREYLASTLYSQNDELEQMIGRKLSW